MPGPPLANLVFQIWFWQSNDCGDSVTAIFLGSTTTLTAPNEDSHTEPATTIDRSAFTLAIPGPARAETEATFAPYCAKW
jgi:hypothetical protein